MDEKQGSGCREPEAPEAPIQGAVFHSTRHPERMSCTVAMELPDCDFLANPDRAAAEAYLDGLLVSMRRLFLGAWEQMRG